MFCDECGFENKENAKFCKKCGAKLTDEIIEKENVEKTLENEFETSKDDMKLSKNQLLDYLNTAKELEINRLGLKNSIADLNLLNKRKHEEIVRPIAKKEKPKLEDAKTESNMLVTTLFGGIIGLGAIGIIPLYIVVMALCWRYGPDEWKRGFTLFFIPIGIILGVAAVLAIIMVILNTIIGNTFGRRKYKKYVKKYEKENAEIDKANNLQLEKYGKQKDIIVKRIDCIDNDLKDVEKTLNKYYDLDVIYQKYRNLVAITTFIEYLESGRCNSLYGYTGCYNVYEQEIRQNAIIGKLDQVLISLEQVKKVQFATYLAIQQSNALQSAMLNTCNEMLDETRRENALLEAQAQDNKIIKRNSEIVSTISTLNYIKHN